MTSDKEQPAERYIRLRDNPEQWEQEMIDFGLNEYERGIMHEHLDKDCGTLSSQEGMMLLLMDERIANLTYLVLIVSVKVFQRRIRRRLRNQQKISLKQVEN